MTYVQRTLWCKTDDARLERLGEADLLGRPESLIVLGEPGMGKSRLLRGLAEAAGITFCTARKLINRPNPRSLVGEARLIIIDALDEVSASREGGAVDLVLQKLGELDYPLFVLSCRVADWQAATSVAAICEQYPAVPLQLHLDPLNRGDQLVILSDIVGEARAEELIRHFEGYGLDYLGNPQTLELIARLPTDQPLPTSSAALFELAVDKLRVEHRNGLGRQELRREDALDAAGAAFASLILSGASVIRRTGQANLAEGELPVGEVDGLAGGHLENVFGTRLFAGSEDGFTYWHRRIGEYLGAGWLAKRADTRAKRRRLLHLFQAQGLVPANLRGLHAWLARDPHLTGAVIAADPMGIIEYGDADDLTAPHARALFAALESLACRNPRFWQRGVARAAALVSAPLQEQADRVIRDRQAPLVFRLLLLEQLSEAGRAEPYRDTLRLLLQDTTEIFSIRRQAGAALANLNGEKWGTLVEYVRQQPTHNSARLAYEMMQVIGLGAFSDRQIVEVVLTYGGLILSAWPQGDPDNLTIRFWRLPEMLPLDRLNGVLNMMTDYLRELLPKGAGIDHNDLIDAVQGLILRRLDLGSVEPLRLWGWLQTLGNERLYWRDKTATLAEWLRAQDEVRQSIQRHVLLDAVNEPIWSKLARLTRANSGLMPDEADIISLLGGLNSPEVGDNRWFELLRHIRHDAESGRAARQAAEKLAGDDAVRRQRIARLAIPTVPEWQIEQERWEQQLATEREKQFAEARRSHLENIDRIRAGEFRYLHDAALAYLRRFDNVGNDCPAHERIAEWLGPEIAAAAHEGFEAFLTVRPPSPSAMRIALSFANKRRYLACDVIVAALAERLRLRSDPFVDLPDERLMAGLFDLWSSGIEEHAGVTGLADRLEADLRQRGAWEQAIRLFIGTQLRCRCTYVGYLYKVMRAESDTVMATTMGLEWLQAYPDLTAEPEAEIIDRILRSPRRGELGPIGDVRRLTPLDDERRRNWDAVQILLDLDSARVRLHATVERDLLWHIRCRTADDDLNGRSPLSLDSRQLAWIVTTFRALWPACRRPIGGTVGDNYPWDASEYLFTLISRLGDDTTDEAVRALKSLRDAPPDGYTEHIRVVAAEQRQKCVEQAYRSPTITEIAAILDGRLPTTAADLQAVMLENLSTAQCWLRGNDVDWYRGFFQDDGKHKHEEPCRDELIKMLRAIDDVGLEYIPESHVADDKRVDIVVQAADRLILPIEVKGQWHPDLWTAADRQLDYRYVNDWRAERGIYLVLWFGEAVAKPRPPGGVTRPQTPEELREALQATSRAAQAGRVDVVVLDLTRPPTGA